MEGDGGVCLREMGHPASLHKEIQSVSILLAMIAIRSSIAKYYGKEKKVWRMYAS